MKENFTKNELTKFIKDLKEERNIILSKLSLLSKDQVDRLNEIDDKISHFTSLLDKDGIK